MPDPVVRLEALTYEYPRGASPALRAVDLEISPGEFVVLAGRSGSGKSTLLRALCGLVPHYYGGAVAGTAEVGGLDVRDHGPADLGGRAGLVAQDPETQVVSATVRGELELPLEMRGEPAPTRARAVEEVALALGIGDLLGRAVDTLSGGELQRVALAAALVVRPELVLLDEPTSQLDPVAGDELIWLLRRLNEEWGLTVVIAEHRLERCLAAADRVVAMAEGAIAYDGDPRGFLGWALAADPALATPGAHLFRRAGIEPLPTGVKDARATLEEKRRAGSRHGVADPVGSDFGSDGRRPNASSSRDRALATKNLWVRRSEREVLRGLDLEIAPGERVALMGRNGAGKTTLLRTVAGLEKPLRGRCATPRGSALVPQSPSDLLVREQVREELPGPAGMAALEAVDLSWAAATDPRDLSGGERQRLALALVLAGRRDGTLPALVCLDEPTRGMDRARKEALSDWLTDLARAGAAVLVATHEVEFAATFADRVVMIAEGVVIADGAPSEILSGGWYFATEVARILGGSGAIDAESGARLLGNVGVDVAAQEVRA